MAQFMDDHIIENGRRRKHKPPVEREGASGTAAAPAGFLVADGDAVKAPACQRKEMRGTFRKIFFCRFYVTFFQGCTLGVRQVGNGAAFGMPYGFQIVRDDPVLLVQQKMVDLRFGSAKRQAQGDLSLRGDADGTGFAAAVDYLAGEFIKFALVFDAVYAFHSCDYIMEKGEKQAARLYTFPENGYNMSVTGGMKAKRESGCKLNRS